MLRVAICGAGMRSRRVWQRHLSELPSFELAAIMDPSRDALAASVQAGHVDPDRCFTDLRQMLSATQPDVLLACPIISAHGEAVRAGLESGAHVLVEKPFVTDLDEARNLVELAESCGQLLGVVQNWRTRSAGMALKRALDEGRVGPVSHVFFRYLRDREQSHLPEYLFDEPDPILWAMGVHHLDLFRYVLDDDLILAEGRASRPPWSRYRVPSVNHLWFETRGGVNISYVASFSSRQSHIPQESLQVEGEHGTIYNDSDYLEPPLWLSLRGAQGGPIDLTADVSEADREYQRQYDIADVAILENFRAAVESGEPLIAAGRDNLGTLAAIEAARVALASGRG